ncbi:MAG: LysR family transcriptional regulator [Alphaproteobacteria bacterium]|nr:LysR family transcriptional regulator [Alphaproteobacteria bacterium]
MQDLPRGFDLKSLRAFVAAVELGGMTQAARQLGMTQSNMSQIIGHLEEAVDAALFDRSARPITPTSAGHSFYHQAREILMLADESLRNVGQRQRDTISSLTIAMPDSVANTIGAQLLQSLRPKARRLQLWSGISPHQHDALLSRSVDMVITASDALAQTDGLIRLPLLREPYVLVLPHDHSGPTDIKTLAASLPFIRYTLRSLIGRQIEGQLNRMKVRPPVEMEFDSAPSQLAAVGSGMGWSLTTPLCLRQDMSLLSGLRVLALDRNRFGRSLSLIAREDWHPDIADVTAQSATAILQRDAIAPIIKAYPWMEDSIEMATS